MTIESKTLAKPTGAPTKLTPERQAKILEYIRQGNYIHTACQAAGITDQTFRNWRQRAEDGEQPYSDFFEAVKRAEAEAEPGMVGSLTRHGSDNWVAAATFLERKYPTRWGRHDRVDHELSQQGIELLQELRKLGERPQVAGPVVEGEIVTEDGPKDTEPA